MSGRLFPGDFACPWCGAERAPVVDTRGVPDRSEIVRVRKCSNCKVRFTTVERHERSHLTQDRVRNMVRKLEEVLRGLKDANPAAPSLSRADTASGADGEPRSPAERASNAASAAATKQTPPTPGIEDR